MTRNRMKTIWKFEIPVTDQVTIDVPEGAEFLRHVHAIDRTTLWLWAVVDPARPLVARTIHILGTGHAHDMLGIPGGLHHIGSVVTPPFVWHVFDEAQEVPF